MQRRHRRAHRLLWIFVLVAAATAFAVSLQVRPEYSIVQAEER